MDDHLESALRKLATLELTDDELAALDAFLADDAEVEGFLDPQSFGLDPAKFALDPALFGVLRGRRSAPAANKADGFHGPPGTGKT